MSVLIYLFFFGFVCLFFVFVSNKGIRDFSCQSLGMQGVECLEGFSLFLFSFFTFNQF